MPCVKRIDEAELAVLQRTEDVRGIASLTGKNEQPPVPGEATTGGRNRS